MYKQVIHVSEAYSSRQNGQVRSLLTFRGKSYMTQMFFPSLKVPSRQITDAVQKVYPDARVTQYTMSTLIPLNH